MNPEEVYKQVDSLEKETRRRRTADIKTQRFLLMLYPSIKKLVKYQVPTPPVQISDDHHHFTCPTCKTRFESEDTAEDFAVCYICGQRWK